MPAYYLQKLSWYFKDMKQTNKVLLPLGLFMSIVIPITVKSLFTETDFFEKDETSRIDYLQPYKMKPETGTDLPSSSYPTEAYPATTPNAAPEPRSSSRHSNDDRKLNIPSGVSSVAELELLNQIESSTDESGIYK